MTDHARSSAESESARFINCEICQTEGRILTNDGGPDDVDHGVCPACNGERVVEVKTRVLTPEDIEAMDEALAGQEAAMRAAGIAV